MITKQSVLRGFGWVVCVWMFIAGVLSISELLSESTLNAYTVIAVIPALVFMGIAAFIVKRFLWGKGGDNSVATHSHNANTSKKDLMDYVAAVFVWFVGLAFVISGVISLGYPVYPEYSVSYNAVLSLMAIVFGGFIVWKWMKNNRNK